MIRKTVLAGTAAFAVIASTLVATAPAVAADGDHVVISEAYLNGGSTDATYLNKYVELYNPTDAAVPLDGWSLQYRAYSSTSAASVTALTGSIPAGGSYLIQGTANSTNGADWKATVTPDAVVTSSWSGNANGGTLILANTTTAQNPTAGSVVSADDAIVDLLGYTASNTFETAVAAGPSTVATAFTRNGSNADSDDNATDFTLATDFTPTNSAGVTYGDAEEPEEPEEPTPADEASIAEIQGTGSASPLVDTEVITRGVVTAAYPTGGLRGYNIQTPGTGGAIDFATHTASDGLFVFSPSTVGDVEIGDYVEVTGVVTEYFGLTQMTVTSASGLEILPDAVEPVVPADVAFPATDAHRESLEGMLIAPAGDYTVADNYETNYYGEVGLAAGDDVLHQPSDVARPGSDAFDDVVADNAARGVLLDDGASTNFNTTKTAPIPYLSLTDPVRVGAAVEFLEPVILDYRFDLWRFQPTAQVLGDAEPADLPVSFENTREDAPQDVGGDISVAGFNVLNYFTTVGTDLTGCTYYTDRAGDPVTVSGGCSARGAADAENFERQQTKIVAAINALDADVVSLEEIENSAKFGEDRDAALAELVAALNADAGAERWAFVPSPEGITTAQADGEDVIRTAFIYQVGAVEPIGPSRILFSAAFSNAREPLAQTFVLPDAPSSEGVVVVANHFKSKGCDGATGADADAGDGQACFNAARVAQAEALLTWTDTLQTLAGTDKALLVGDFNAYGKEDPAQTILDAGYSDLGADAGEDTYLFSGLVGSLDHVFASAGATDVVTGVDTWNINAFESIALEYSRYNYNVKPLYDESPFRSSDHDPIKVGLDLTPAATDDVTINLIDINDFHGRIDANTVKFAGTVAQLEQQFDAGSTIFTSAGDNIGASLFASATQDDQPTLEVLNALGLDVSTVGNHEFDKGFDDLAGRVTDESDFPYLGANVYWKNTKSPALPQYFIQEVDGVRVGIIGAITEETPALVSPGGIETLTFGDPVEAVNRVAAQLTDGRANNGEADVIIASYHEGAGAGTPDGATLEEELGEAGAFEAIVNDTTPLVSAIFTGHTHKFYVWDAPTPGVYGATRPVVQTGNYGENLGQITLTVDPATKEVVDYAARNVARDAVTADAELTETYAQVATVSGIVTEALAYAAEVGNEPVGSITADITTAFIGSSRDDRANESTLGDLVADSILTTLAPAGLGGADIGVVNPGGLRGELRYAASGSEGDGVVTYAEANAVLPFVNNLWTTTLTGAQFKEVLEEQWQPDGSSRPYLQLGLSDNVTYTYDATKSRGEKITSITVDGEPIDPAAEYRIGSFSFLLQGGDNFTTFADGANTTDSGLVDRDAWIAYLEANPALAPDFARQAVAATGVPTEPVPAGTELEVTLSKLDLTSLGSPANTAVTARLDGEGAEIGAATVTGGAATLTVAIPADAAEGDHQIVVTAAPSGTTVRIPLTIAPEPDDGIVDLQLLDINDFHGRIDTNTVKFAGTIAQLEAAFGAENTLFLSAGDNIGASLFASSIAGDIPTIEVLNALGLDVAAAGNHEFDQGFADLTGRVADAADFDYLGANVYLKNTNSPALPEYATFEVDGLTVAVVGAITEETPALVSPGGIENVEFGDPVEAVNRVAAKLSDGRTNNGEADVIIALYHEGASAGTPDGATLEEELAAGGAFEQIVNDTTSDVDVIFTGHTHKLYAWDAPVPGEYGKTRPVVQTGDYGANIGRITLEIDRETGEVLTYDAENVARTTTSDADLIAAYPQVAEVDEIVTAALAAANEVGKEPVGSITADITTAFLGSSRDDRANESTLGDLVADSLVASLADETLGGAEIGVVNPGGLRAELLYAAAGEEAEDGIVTYAEANAVLPFVNNLWTTTLTGAQFKDVLEEQWQPDGSSRPYLQLGLSSNVTYTYDAAQPRGERITSITVDGEPIDPAGEYRIGSFNFLLQGGDNFTTFADGTDTRDSGLVDRDAWIAYLEANPALSPDFARQAVALTGAPAEPVAAGDAFTLQLSKLDLTSLGSPLNTEVTATLGDVEVGTAAVTAGAATLEVTVPEDAADGAQLLTVVAEPTGTTVTVPLEVTAPTTVESTTEATVTSAWAGEGIRLQVAVAAGDVQVDGVAEVQIDGGATRTFAIVDGAATLTLSPRSYGAHELEVRFLGSDSVEASSTTVDFTVKRGASTTSLSLGKTTTGVYAFVRVTPSRPVSATGRVTITTNGVARMYTLSAADNGRLKVKVANVTSTGKRITVRASYAASATVLGSTSPTKWISSKRPS